MVDPIKPNTPPPPNPNPAPGAPDLAKQSADAKAAADKKLADDKAKFDADQKAKAAAFEQSQKAAATKNERDSKIKLSEAEARAKQAKADTDNDQKALEDGLLTHHDLLHRGELASKYPGTMLPWQAMNPGDPTVKMAFPKTMVLTVSSSELDPELEDPPAIHHGTQVLFRKGYQDVPVALADHQYLYDGGAYRVGSDGKAETLEARQARIKAANDKAAAAAKK
jgi:hypothetical protein